MLVLVRADAIRVLAVHDARLARIDFQPERRQPSDDRVEYDLRSWLAFAVQDHIVCVALERGRESSPGWPGRPHPDSFQECWRPCLSWAD
jgi:hypothetical protein